MSNSPQVIFAHYRELVKPAGAGALFEILPTFARLPGPVLANVATEAKPVRNVQAVRRARRIMAEMHGRTTPRL